MPSGLQLIPPGFGEATGGDAARCCRGIGGLVFDLFVPLIMVQLGPVLIDMAFGHAREAAFHTGDTQVGMAEGGRHDDEATSPWTRYDRAIASRP